MFYIFTKLFKNVLNFINFFMKNYGEFYKFLCDFNINFQNFLSFCWVNFCWMSPLRTEILATLLEILWYLPSKPKSWVRRCIYIYIYIYVQGGAKILVRGVTSDKISYMISSQVLYCNGVSKISVRRRDIQQKCTHHRLLKIFQNL